MSEREYLNEKFDILYKTLKWWVVTALSAFFIFLGTFGGLALANRGDIKQIEFDLMLLDTRTEDLKYKTGWLTELNEIQRDFIKAYTNDEDVSEFLETLNRMEKRIMAGGDPMPTLRSYKRKYK